MCSETRTTVWKGGSALNFDYSKLRGKIKEVFGTQDRFASALGIGHVSLSQRLNNNLDFSSTEIFASCKLLNISAEAIPQYFFTPKVQKHEQIPA